MLTMHALLERYALEHDCRSATIAQLRHSIHSLERYLMRHAVLEDLCDDTVNLWLQSLSGMRAAETIRSKRRAILTLWRAAYDTRLVSVLPDRIRRIRGTHGAPSAWSVHDLRSLLEQANCEAGRMPRRDIPWALYWRAFILAGYQTGLRRADLLALRFDQINTTGRLMIRQQKTGRSIVVSLDADALAAIDAIRIPERELVFGVLSARRLSKRFKELVRRAGLQGSIKWLRRSGATSCEACQPGAASIFLGHSRPGLAEVSYIDARLIQRERPKPPRIEA